jgi:hypothetical protein
MRRPIWQGIGILGLAWGFGAGEARAQGYGPGAAGDPGAARVPLPLRSAAPRGVSTPPVRPAAYQPLPPTPSPTTPPATNGATSPPIGTAPPVTPPPSELPPVPPGTGTSLESNIDLSLPKSEREGGGGEPTEVEEKAEEAEAPPTKDETKLLMNALGRADAPVKVYGWIQNSFTYNADGRGPTSTNFGVNPNYLADRWMGNQYYLVIENPLEQNDRVNLGFRVDNLFGNDWVFNHMRGLNEHSFRLNHFLGYDPAQIYGEIHLPWLTKGGIDVKGGRFYTILGYEVVPAIGRPLLSVPYMFNYGQPFTHLGMLSTLHLTDRINIYNGTVNGYDRWFNANYKWNYIGGWTWTSKDTKANFAMSYIWGPNQYPRFLSGTNQQIFLLGNTIPPHLDGRRNLGYGSNNRLSFTNVFSYKWTDKLTQVQEVDLSVENNIPGSGGVPQHGGTFSGGTDRNDSWQAYGNWFLYAFNDKWTGVWRSEIFRDDGGQRTGFRDTFYEQTLGFIWKPKPYIWVRPEARYDWSQFTSPFDGGTRKSQLTLAIDAILLF